MIPQTFNEWTTCIVHDCKINLTKDFATQRLAVYLDKKMLKRKSSFRFMVSNILKILFNGYNKYDFN